MFGEEDHKEASDRHGDHASYDADLLRRTITSGRIPAGNLLDEAMLRWSMAQSDLDDLVAFLMQSNPQE